MFQIRDILFFSHQSLVAATPLVVAGAGELVAERSGVINIGIEGMMLMGCFTAYATAVASGSSLLGLLAAIGTGIILAGLFAIITIWLRADQIVSGTALNFLAAGISATAWGAVNSNLPKTEAVVSFYVMVAVASVMAITAGVVLTDLFTVVAIGLRIDRFMAGIIRNILAAVISATALYAIILNLPAMDASLSLYVMVGVAGIMAMAVWLWLNFTRTGLIIRALGDSPDACSAAGIRVRWWRTGCVLFGGACAGAAGAYLSIMRIFQFSPDQTGGIGFLVLAMVIFGRWNMLGLVAGCFLFGLADVLQRYGQGASTGQHSHEDLFRMLPYVATLVALAILTRAKAAPRYLGRPWPEDAGIG